MTSIGTQKTVAITGASGFIGSALTGHLEGLGYSVLRIGRAKEGSDGPDIAWSPANGVLDGARLEGVDAVVHLAGASIAERWSDEQKAAIRNSRIEGTTLLATTLARLTKKPRVLVSGSAIGIYGNRGDTVLDERSTLGDDFLARVGVEWEACTAPAEAAGIRVVHIRTGIVQHPSGGALAKQLPLFKLGVGGPLSSGDQWLSPISLADHVRAVAFCIEHESMHGPVNLVAPTPVTNETFTDVLADALHRPAFARVPAFALRLALGADMANHTVLASQRVLPTKLLADGFDFLHPDIASIVQAAIAADA